MKKTHILSMSETYFKCCYTKTLKATTFLESLEKDSGFN